jgi:hypothetical protein
MVPREWVAGASKSKGVSEPLRPKGQGPDGQDQAGQADEQYRRERAVFLAPLTSGEPHLEVRHGSSPGCRLAARNRRRTGACGEHRAFDVQARVSPMQQTAIMRPLLPGERQQLRSGLRSHKGFTLRRCQILLAADRGRPAAEIAQILGCARATVSAVFKDFNTRGVSCVHEERRRGDAAHRGRPRVEERQPGIIGALEQLLVGEVAGDPMSEKGCDLSSARESQRFCLLADTGRARVPVGGGL